MPVGAWLWLWLGMSSEVAHMELDECVQACVGATFVVVAAMSATVCKHDLAGLQPLATVRVGCHRDCVGLCIAMTNFVERLRVGHLHKPLTTALVRNVCRAQQVTP